MAANSLREEIVDLASECDGLGGIELFCPGNGMREDLDIDSGRIHIGDATFVKIAEEFGHPSHSCLRSLGSLFQRAPWTLQKGWSRVVLFYCDCSHRLRLFLPRHTCFPAFFTRRYGVGISRPEHWTLMIGDVNPCFADS